MREIDHPPSAPSLMEAMRSIGYSLGSALADLIDNSIAANARHVEIRFDPTDDPYVAVLDDGNGMSADDLENAMRHGSRNPTDARHEDDLGRFGLGLKTASMSQCKRMTVISVKDGMLSARAWDMDLINSRRSWVLLGLDESEASELPTVSDLIKQGHGTVVIWQKLDRLLAGEFTPQVALGQRIDDAREHLALVFHRFLDAEPGTRKLTISINGTPIAGLDPFLIHNSLTQKLQEECFDVEGKRVRVKPFILPHPSRLSPPEIATAGGAEGLRALQGFYVYRQRRLIIWGTWFRLARKDELSRLARVRVDIPNSLDHLWVLDIRKSIASPPEVVRQNLRRTIQRIVLQSHNTHTTKGHKERQSGIVHAWTRVFAGGAVRYEVNTDHEAIRSLAESLSTSDRRRFDAVIRILQTSFPVESLYVDVASEKRVSRQEESEEELRVIAADLVSGMERNSPVRVALLAALPMIEPFSAHPEISQRIATELRQ